MPLYDDRATLWTVRTKSGRLRHLATDHAFQKGTPDVTTLCGANAVSRQPYEPARKIAEVTCRKCRYAAENVHVGGCRIAVLL